MKKDLFILIGDYYHIQWLSNNQHDFLDNLTKHGYTYNIIDEHTIDVYNDWIGVYTLHDYVLDEYVAYLDNQGDEHYKNILKYEQDLLLLLKNEGE